MTASLWAASADRRRIEQARSAILMVGSYDGSGNYGDVLQFGAALDSVRRVRGAPLAVAVVERATHEHHSLLVRRHPDLFRGVAFAHFQEGEGRFGDDLVELASGIGPANSAVYLYGGGYLNRWWGGRKAAQVAAAEQLVGGDRLPLVASGLQVEAEAVAPGGIGHELISRASQVGLRDIRSLRQVRAQVPAAAETAELAGDDAVTHLHFDPVPTGAVVNLHLNSGDWVSDDPEGMIARVLALLRQLPGAAGAPLSLQPIVAYEDPGISERALLTELLARHGGDLEATGIRPGPPLDILADATGNRLGRFRRARLTVSCSYHVALTSLLAGIPALLLAENDYYDQKAAGLRDLFALDRSLVGVAGRKEDFEAAVGALVDGPARAALLDHLRVHSGRVVERYERGREVTIAALERELENGGRRRSGVPEFLRALRRSGLSRRRRRG